MSTPASPTHNSATPELDRLLPRRRRFAEEYGRDGNATQAAIRAGYSPRSARQHAHVMLNDPKVMAAIAALRVSDLGSQNLAVARVQVINELAKIVHASIGDYVRWGPDTFEFRSPPMPGDNLPGVLRATDRKTRYGGSRSIVMRDKLPTINLLARILGLFDRPAKSKPAYVAPPVYYYEPVNSREEWNARHASLAAEYQAQQSQLHGAKPPALPGLLSGKLRRS